MGAEVDMHPADAHPSHAEVRLLAFQLWQERGAPFGTPEIDWFRAEGQLKPSSVGETPPLIVAAKTIGGAIGSLAALITNQ
jgi:hypothetical protein